MRINPQQTENQSQEKNQKQNNLPKRLSAKDIARGVRDPSLPALAPVEVLRRNLNTIATRVGTDVHDVRTRLIGVETHWNVYSAADRQTKEELRKQLETVQSECKQLSDRVEDQELKLLIQSKTIDDLNARVQSLQDLVHQVVGRLGEVALAPQPAPAPITGDHTCADCGLTLSGPAPLAAHLAGKNHAKVLRMRAARAAAGTLVVELDARHEASTMDSARPAPPTDLTTEGVEPNPGPDKQKKQKQAAKQVKRAAKKVEKAVAKVRHEPKRHAGGDQVGQALGAAVGSLLGPTASHVGRLIGGGAQSLFKTITGFGSYRMRTAQRGGNFSNNVAMGTGPAIMHNAATPRVRHRELITNVYATTNFSTNIFRIQPGLFSGNTLFPWLSGIASNFQQYRLHGMEMYFESTSTEYSSSINLGSVMMSTVYDPTDDALASSLAIGNHEFSTDGPPSKSFYHPIECDPKQNDFTLKMIRNYTQAPSALNDWGIFQISTEGNPVAGALIGRLWATYDIEFLKPVLPIDASRLLTSFINVSLGPANSNVPANPVQIGYEYLKGSTFFPVPSNYVGAIRITIPNSVSGIFSVHAMLKSPLEDLSNPSNQLVISSGGPGLANFYGIPNQYPAPSTYYDYRSQTAAIAAGGSPLQTTGMFVVTATVPTSVRYIDVSLTSVWASQNVWAASSRPAAFIIITQLPGNYALTATTVFQDVAPVHATYATMVEDAVKEQKTAPDGHEAGETSGCNPTETRRSSFDDVVDFDTNLTPDEQIASLRFQMDKLLAARENANKQIRATPGTGG